MVRPKKKEQEYVIPSIKAQAYNQACDDWEAWINEIVKEIPWENDVWRKLKGEKC